MKSQGMPKIGAMELLKASNSDIEPPVYAFLVPQESSINAQRVWKNMWRRVSSSFQWDEAGLKTPFQCILEYYQNDR